MKQIDFDNIYAFCNYALEIHENMCDDEEFNNVITFVAKYEDAKEIINFATMEGYELVFAEFEQPDFNNYRDEYYIKIVDNDIWVEKAKRNGKYAECDNSIVFIIDGSSSTILKHIDSDIIFDIAFVDENHVIEYDKKYNNCASKDNTEFLDENETDIKTEKYTVNGKEVDKKTYQEAVKDIQKYFNDYDDKFTSIIQDSLLSMCRFRDMSNQFLADFKNILF